jgi:uncharacterized protein YjbI with pentapeptide repeats
MTLLSSYQLYLYWAGLAEPDLPEQGKYVICQAVLSHAELTEPSWAKLSQAEPSWAKLSQAEPSWAKLSQAEPSWAKLSQAEPSWAKLSQA